MYCDWKGRCSNPATEGAGYSARNGWEESVIGLIPAAAIMSILLVSVLWCVYQDCTMEHPRSRVVSACPDQSSKSKKNDVISTTISSNVGERETTSSTLRRRQCVPDDEDEYDMSTQTSSMFHHSNVNDDSGITGPAQSQLKSSSPTTRASRKSSDFVDARTHVDRHWTSATGFSNNNNSPRSHPSYDCATSNAAGSNERSNGEPRQRQSSDPQRSRVDAGSSTILDQFIDVLRCQQRERQQLTAIRDSTIGPVSTCSTSPGSPRVHAAHARQMGEGSSENVCCHHTTPTGVSCQSSSVPRYLQEQLEKERHQTAKLRAEIVRLSIINELQAEWSKRLWSELSEYTSIYSANER